MRTEKQAEASRINRAKSKGPVTEEGKDMCKRNALKTGMHSMGFVLPEHMETEIVETITWIYGKLNPDNHIEHKLTQSLAHHLVAFTEAVQQQIHHKLKISERTLCAGTTITSSPPRSLRRTFRSGPWPFHCN